LSGVLISLVCSVKFNRYHMFNAGTNIGQTAVEKLQNLPEICIHKQVCYGNILVV